MLSIILTLHSTLLPRNHPPAAALLRVLLAALIARLPSAEISAFRCATRISRYVLRTRATLNSALTAALPVAIVQQRRTAVILLRLRLPSCLPLRNQPRFLLRFSLCSPLRYPLRSASATYRSPRRYSQRYHLIALFRYASRFTPAAHHAAAATHPPRCAFPYSSRCAFC